MHQPGKPQVPETVEEYIALAPLEVQPRLRDMRQLIRSVVPKETVERISWGMPTYQLHGALVHFAAQKSHLGFYPGNTGVAFAKAQIEGVYQYTKGGIQLPYAKPLPVTLVEETVRYRVDENIRWKREKDEKKKRMERDG